MVILWLCQREKRYHNDERRKHSHSVQKLGERCVTSKKRLRGRLYKNRPAKRDCTNNYQGIEFPSIAIKLFARVVVKRMLAERFYSESWCGFPAKRSMLLGLIACPARRSIRSVWSRLRHNGHKRYLPLNHLLGGTFQLTQYFFSFFGQSRAVFYSLEIHSQTQPKFG